MWLNAEAGSGPLAVWADAGVRQAPHGMKRVSRASCRCIGQGPGQSEEPPKAVQHAAPGQVQGPAQGRLKPGCHKDTAREWVSCSGSWSLLNLTQLLSDTAGRPSQHPVCTLQVSPRLPGTRSREGSAGAAAEAPLAYQDASMPEAPPMSFRHMFLRSSALEQLAVGSPPLGQGPVLESGASFARLPAEAGHGCGAWTLLRPAVWPFNICGCWSLVRTLDVTSSSARVGFWQLCDRSERLHLLWSQPMYHTLASARCLSCLCPVCCPTLSCCWRCCSGLWHASITAATLSGRLYVCNMVLPSTR